jgi:hypothetical protein
MEPFRLDRQSKSFLAVLLIVALALIPLAPFASLAFGALSLVVLCIVFLMALARNRRVFGPLSKAEGALALSAGVFAIAGALVIAYATLMLGAGNARLLSHAMLPFSSSPDGPRPVGDRSVWSSDPDQRQRLKEELAKAGVPFKVEVREGKEYVKWSQEHDAIAEAISRKVRDGPFPSGRNARFEDPALQRAFSDWLTERGVRHETVKQHGEDWIAWEGQENLAHEFMTTRPVKPCGNEAKTARGDRGLTPNC